MAQKRGSAQDARGMQRPESATPDHATLGEGVLINGVDAEVARRAHMRDLTTARQAAEQARRQGRVRTSQTKATPEARQVALQTLAAVGVATLAEIEAAHQTWLRVQEVLVTTDDRE